MPALVHGVHHVQLACPEGSEPRLREFRAAHKAHPGLLVRDLDACAQRLRDSGCDVTPDQELPGYRRLYTADPVGNRLELLEPATPTSDLSSRH